MFKAGVLKFLQSRLLVQDCNSNSLSEVLDEGPVTLYMGVDPTAPGFHLGHLFALRVLKIFQEFGHRVILVIGGATGLVGDPTGKDSSRKQLSSSSVKSNAQALRKELERLGLLSFGGTNPALLLNNADWLGYASFLWDFMPLAFQFSINSMLKMTTFSSRLEDSKPLSLGEMIYPVMQAWDFLELYRKQRCALQVGGSDQWANILWGVDLINSLENAPAYALTFPLLLDAQGKKMGKTSEGETLWLDPERTSPMDLFQYVQKFPDEVLWSTFMRMTDLPQEEVDQIVMNPRIAQIRLAYEITKLVHGVVVARKTESDFNALAEGSIDAKIATLEVPCFPFLLNLALMLSDSLPSKGQVRQRMRDGAVWIVDGSEKPPKIYDATFELTGPCVVRFGKGKYLKVLMEET